MAGPQNGGIGPLGLRLSRGTGLARCSFRLEACLLGEALLLKALPFESRLLG